MRPVVIVDPVSSGSELAPAFAHRQIPCIAVKSMPGPLWEQIYKGGFGSQIPDSQFLKIYEDRPDLLHTLREHQPRAIIAGAESGVELADRLAAELTPELANLPELTRARRHKGLMQAALENAGLPVIRTLTTASPSEVKDWLKANNLTSAALVVKPAASAGSDNVHHIPPGGDWERPFESILASRNTLRDEINEVVIVQERALGVEFAVDTVSAAGEHFLAHLIVYAKTCLEDRLMLFDHTEFVAYQPGQHGELLAHVHKALDALGIRWGAAHCEVMLTAQGPRIIEIGARTCGGPVLEFARAATGSSQLERVVEAYADGLIQSRTYEFKKTVVPVFLNAPKSGILRNVEELESLRHLPTHLRSHLWRRNGDRVLQTIDLDTVLGIVGLAGEREAVFQDYQQIRQAESRLHIEAL